MHLVRHWQEGLCEKLQLLNMHRKFARFRHEQIAFDADEVAMIQQAEQLPTIRLAAFSIIAHAHDILSAHIHLQARDAVRQMHERGFAHHARRRGQASRDTHANLVQLGISQFELFG